MESLVQETEKYVISYLNDNLDSKFVYHNLAHTQRVVGKVQELIESIKLDEPQKSHLLIAAWFHDTGFTKTIEGHEKESAKIASAFLKSQGASEDTIHVVSDIILATQMDLKPKNELEGLIRDADCAHVSSKKYDEYAALLRKEWELTKGKIISKPDWIQDNISFLTNHTFYSDIAARKWEKRKGQNLARLLQSQNKIKERTEKLKQKKAELSFKKKKMDLPERGIETMFRVALRNHITLSDIADTKANILLSVNAIIISLVLSNLVSKLDNPSNQYLIWPTAIFALFTLASIVLSVLATRPNVTRGKFTKEDVANKKVNLLFFGNFHKMKLDEFEWAMTEMMQDRDYLYSSLTKDLYFLGLVLNRKYGLLRLTYTVFMIGIVVSVICFAVAFQLSESNTLIDGANSLL
ncbi:Predicted metal-dependent phosphohydrolase, HD superfamily [Formosa sp. Hel1_31_208]|uniref:Pycsar system effector family protein n=1 Tax=Formosa sp. Hel1_31_208 TaxID=1798225 RepID=UPI00087CDE06|nr:Pycsar system effector family protein [Formosa sp. Hel1_31_208]SDR86628.1 Predicted metal-dependent phosphohydrolase, HD superfamily [Formosa sp. Hel1_31_208]